MKLFILACVMASAWADVSHILSKSKTDESNAEIESQALDTNPEGSYFWSFKTSNGIEASEEGKTNAGPEGGHSVRGQSSWNAPEGDHVQISYIADENGYQPQGAVIPTPHPIPEAIIRALQYIQEHPPPPENKKQPIYN